MKKIMMLLISIVILIACSDDKSTNTDGFNIDKYNVIALFGFNQSLVDNSTNKIELIAEEISYSMDRNQKGTSALLLNSEYSFIFTDEKFNSVLDLSPTFTLSMWIKPDLNACRGDKLGYIDVIGRWFATGDSASSYSVCILKDKLIEGRTYNFKGDKGNTWIKSSTTLSDNEWSNIIVTRNENGLMFIYLNGEEIAKGIVNAPQGSNYELYIGKRRDYSTYFIGLIDDVIILDDYIDESQIENLMNYNIK